MYHILNSETKRCTWISESTSCRDHPRAPTFFRLPPWAQLADHFIWGKKWEIMRVTKHSMYLQVVQLFNEMFIVVATPGEGTCSSVGSARYTACALRWLGHHGEDELANPPQTDTVSRQPGLGCYPHVCDSFSQEDCNVWSFFFFLSF